MATWEYRRVLVDTGEMNQMYTFWNHAEGYGKPIDESLLALGAEGWELVISQPAAARPNTSPRAWWVFKRQIS